MNPKSYSQKSELSRILVALSGGIHSAVTAALLKTQGYEVIGIHFDYLSTMRAELSTTLGKMENSCLNRQGLPQARKIAEKLGISFHVVDVSELFERVVVEEMVHKTLQGDSPNPCVSCHRMIKFETLFYKAAELRCEKAATGHGAQIQFDPQARMAHIFKGSDPQRDHSYFLFGLSQERLSRLLLPLGGFLKNRIEKLAGEFGIEVTTDNFTEFCFAASPFYPKFIESRVPSSLMAKGVIRSPSNEVLGDHQGLHSYRVGIKPEVQLSMEETETFVVVGSDPATHTLLLGPKESLNIRSCRGVQFSWLMPLNQIKGLSAHARLHPMGECVPCLVTFFENNTVQIQFVEPVGPALPGQPIAIYKDNELLGGGWIRK